jgi:tetratricopeptide (TPR) repeat protein
MPPALDASPPPPPGALRVMISSTTLDLPEHRKAAEDAILRAGGFPLAMEHATARSGSDAIRFSRSLVDQTDIYVGVFGHRYGTVPEDPVVNRQRWSATEHEYRRAVERHIPVLGFVMHQDHPVTLQDVEQEPEKIAKLRALEKEVLQGICGIFTSPANLGLLVFQALIEEMQRLGRAAASPQHGPAAAIPRPPDLYAVPPYTLATAFIGRTTDLDHLDAWAASADPVLVIEAIGGMGKSALAWDWVRQRAALSLPGLAGRVWWSFYERGTSMVSLLRHALAYVTRQNPEGLRRLRPHDIGLRLLGELRQRPYLLVLDGFERVLTAYHRQDKAQLRDDRVAADARECTHPRDGDLLRQLIQCAPSKILLSTRLMPRLLEDRFTHRPTLGVRHLQLAGLAPADALALVRAASIRGDRGRILRFIDQFDRHALILRIVCGLVADHRAGPNDFDAWLADPAAGGSLRLSELPLVQRHTHILEHALRGLGERTRQLLSRIAVLSDGADYDTIAVLNPFLPGWPLRVEEPGDLFATAAWRRLQERLCGARSSEEREAAEAEMAAFRESARSISEAYNCFLEAQREWLESAEHRAALVDFHAALHDLEERGLLQWDRTTDTYDLHPVVRSVAFERLEAGDRAQTYDAIRDHFAALPPEPVEDATELSQVRNSLEIVRALIGAGRIEEAADFCRGDLSNSLLFSIGAHHTVVELWDPLVHGHSQKAPAALGGRDRSYVLNDLAIALGVLGRDDEARAQVVEAIGLDLKQRNSPGLAIELHNLADVADRLNMRASADRAEALGHELAEAADAEEIFTLSLLNMAASAIVEGRFAAAVSLLATFSQRQRPPRALYRPGDLEYWQAVMQLFQGGLTAEDLDRAETIAAEGRNIKRQGFLATLRAEWEVGRGNSPAALDAVDRALALARRQGVSASDHLALRAVALAALGRTGEAREALVEGEDTQRRGYSRFPLFASQAWLALGDHDQARRHLRLAYPLAWADGPPHVRWHDLQRCRELMAALDEPEPRLPPFDPAGFEPQPHEAEIRALIKELRAAKEAKSD